ncbi:altered inheritance of mitochondria protein 3 [[Candida] railenensis]|uniref:Altered inheritance of mitochondria protein 3 n=1 Tax=[Candida] railenensis TaxID=45579 RepID=A0A9P0VVP2_9ASCO|nr:altered inheritance of mitochondria protein 3 [[Candida] railenensis]
MSSFWDNNKGTFKSVGVATAKGIGRGTKAVGKAGYKTYKNHKGETVTEKVDGEEGAAPSVAFQPVPRENLKTLPLPPKRNVPTMGVPARGEPSPYAQYQQPVAQQPVAQQLVAQQPGYQQPVAQQPGYQQPVAQQPSYQQPGYQQPVAQQPGYQQPVVQQPPVQQPGYQQTVAQPGYQQPEYQQQAQPQGQQAAAPPVYQPSLPQREVPTTPTAQSVGTPPATLPQDQAQTTPQSGGMSGFAASAINGYSKMNAQPGQQAVQFSPQQVSAAGKLASAAFNGYQQLQGGQQQAAPSQDQQQQQQQQQQPGQFSSQQMAVAGQLASSMFNGNQNLQQQQQPQSIQPAQQPLVPQPPAEQQAQQTQPAQQPFVPYQPSAEQQAQLTQPAQQPFVPYSPEANQTQLPPQPPARTVPALPPVQAQQAQQSPYQQSIQPQLVQPQPVQAEPLEPEKPARTPLVDPTTFAPPPVRRVGPTGSPAAPPTPQRSNVAAVTAPSITPQSTQSSSSQTTLPPTSSSTSTPAVADAPKTSTKYNAIDITKFGPPPPKIYRSPEESLKPNKKKNETVSLHDSSIPPPPPRAGSGTPPSLSQAALSSPPHQKQTSAVNDLKTEVKKAAPPKPAKLQKPQVPANPPPYEDTVPSKENTPPPMAPRPSISSESIPVMPNFAAEIAAKQSKPTKPEKPAIPGKPKPPKPVSLQSKNEKAPESTTRPSVGVHKSQNEIHQANIAASLEKMQLGSRTPPSVKPKPNHSSTHTPPSITPKASSATEPPIKPKPVVKPKPPVPHKPSAESSISSSHLKSQTEVSPPPQEQHVNLLQEQRVASPVPPPPPSRNYRRTAMTLPPKEEEPSELDLELQTGWFANTTGAPLQIPKALQGLDNASSLQQSSTGTSTSYERKYRVRNKDLALTTYTIKWKDNDIANATLCVEKVLPSPLKAQPAPSKMELVNAHQQFGEYVAGWCEHHYGQQVGRGECWDLAHDALEKGCGKHAFVSTYYHHGYPILQLDDGSVTSGPHDDIKRGDILQFKSCIFVDAALGQTKTVGMPDHTSVVLSNDGNSILVAEQNVNNVRTVVQGTYNLRHMTKGQVTAYRPMPKAWAGSL